ncbi:hypothetical protein CYMTET_7629 [Cymbomonas tetramitiformis]|uniref:DNL-type domain-containing protein n=1 Tax=Cymbomonas tetramitiformis TaxID=36881 RepID=A0AAE0LHB1_9CHLO|nr:hypothetical protein CYMTET_7629 [Cymbomonas tetramitiformis]
MQAAYCAPTYVLVRNAKRNHRTWRALTSVHSVVPSRAGQRDHDLVSRVQIVRSHFRLRTLQHCVASTSENDKAKSKVSKLDNPGALQRLDSGTSMALVLGASGVTGLVPKTPEANVPSSKTHSPRRTQRVQFTCNSCGETTVRSINPIALSSGTIFVQCSCCLAQHKLVDNLNIFNDLQGPAGRYIPGTTVHSRGGSKSFQRDRESISKIGRYYAPVDWPESADQ